MAQRRSLTEKKMREEIARLEAIGKRGGLTIAQAKRLSQLRENVRMIRDVVEGSDQPWIKMSKE